MNQTYEEWLKGFYKYVLEDQKIDLKPLPEINDYRVWHSEGRTYKECVSIMTRSH